MKKKTLGSSEILAQTHNVKSQTVEPSAKKFIYEFVNDPIKQFKLRLYGVKYEDD
jgi:hypothetical protein